MKNYKEISSYIKKVLKYEKDIELLEWIYIPILDYPLIARVTLKTKNNADRLETKYKKYLKKGIKVLIRIKNPLTQKQLDKILSNPQESALLAKNNLPKSVRTILDKIEYDAVCWLRKHNILYSCIYEIMYEHNYEPTYCVIAPRNSINKLQKTQKKFSKTALPIELIINKRAVLISNTSTFNNFLNLLFLSETASKKNKSLISYLKTQYK